MKRLKNIGKIAALFVCVLFAAVSLLAADSKIIYAPNGKPLFDFQYSNLDDNDNPADWDIREDRYADLRQALEKGAAYWAEVLGNETVNSTPAIFHVYGSDDQNAGAQSPGSDVPGLTDYTMLGAVLLRNWNFADEMVAEIEIGSYHPYFGSSGPDDPAYHYTGPITHLPRNGDQMHLASTMFHEIGHALGIGSSAFGMTAFNSSLPLYDQSLYDANGNPARPGQAISSVYSPGVFYVPLDGQPTFKGKNVMEVLDGAMPNGLPINGWEGGNVEFSHIELRNSMMSHTQSFQNYCTFLEAELALMQDIGYQIDRKRFYGRSIYNDYLTVDNTVGFDSDATAGVGLHIYGTNNVVTQLAGLNARGYGGIGIRVDGWNNHLTIAPGVGVSAGGEAAIGLALAYGKDHVVVHRGSITAAGPGGRGMSFDFGSNATGDYYDHRGSWIYTFVLDGDRDQTTPAEWSISNIPNRPEHFEQYNGALAKRVDISGSIDAETAIHIADNAYVHEINLLNGANLNGDIVSAWRLDDSTYVNGWAKNLKTPDATDQYGDYGTRGSLTTTLSFGKAMDNAGNSLGQADPNFHMRYDGNIDGRYSMNLVGVGGELEYNGTAKLVKVDNAATLSGTGAYEIGHAPLITPWWENNGWTINYSRDALSGSFTNTGVLAPGAAAIGAMTVRLGNSSVTFPTGHTFGLAAGPAFTNAGTLALNFNPTGNFSSLVVEGTAGADNEVAIGGTRLFKPLADFYANDFTATILNSQTVLTTDIDAGNLTDTAAAALDYTGLTYQFSLASTPGVDGVNTIGGTRTAGIYETIMGEGDAASVGAELDRIAALGNPTPDLRSIFTAIDFTGDRAAVHKTGQELTPALQNSVGTVLNQTQFLINRSLFRDAEGGYAGEVQVSGIASERANASIPSNSRFGRKEGVIFFFSPYGGGGSQSRKGWGVPGYSFWQGGGVLGLEKRTGGGLYGLHLAAGHLQLDGKDSADELKNTNISLGLHAKFNPADWCGGYVFGLARAGADIARQRREVVVNQLRGVNKGEWTGLAAAVLLGGGYAFDFGRIAFGPEASFEYAFNRQPSFTEKDGLGNLSYKSEAYDSLRSNLGVKATWGIAGRALASLSAGWTHEMLDRQGRTRAGFAGYGDSQLLYRAKTPGRDSLTATARVTFPLGDRSSLAVEGGGEFFKNGYNAGWGGFTFTQAF